MSSGVYRIGCTETADEYIGSSSNLHRRELTHLSSLRRGKHRIKPLQSLYDTHGANAIFFRVIEECDSNRFVREKHHIDQCKPTLNTRVGERIGTGRRPVGRQRVSLGMSGDVVEMISDVANEQNRDRSALVEEIARDYLKRLRKISDDRTAKKGGKAR